MKANQPISKEQFEKRLVNLCLRSGLVGFPKDELDQHIILKSAVLLIENEGCTPEKEINEILQLWFLQVCQIQNFDQVKLRRWLVDSGYLTRTSDGICYQVVRPGPGLQYFDPGVDQVDILEVIRAAQAEIERRRKEFLDKK